MKVLILLTLISLNISADDYELDFNYTQVKHYWKAKGADTANFNKDMVGIGLTKWWKSGLGIRAAYQKGGDSQTTGTYAGWTLNMGSITSLELAYRYKFNDRFNVYSGVGNYLIPYPIYNPQGLLAKDDEDDGDGWFYGATYMFSKDLGIGYRFTKYSTIKIREKQLDEWTKGHGLQLIYRF